MPREALIVLAVGVLLGLLTLAYDRLFTVPPVKPHVTDDSDTGRRL